MHLIKYYDCLYTVSYYVGSYLITMDHFAEPENAVDHVETDIKNWDNSETIWLAHEGDIIFAKPSNSKLTAAPVVKLIDRQIEISNIA